MKIKLLIIILLSSFSCTSQENKIEKIYNDCYFDSMPKNGKQLKIYFKEYESLLISNNILEGTSGKSYYKLFKKIAKEGFYDNKTNYSLIDTINKLDYAKLVHSNKKCTDKIKSLEDYKNSNSYLLEKRIQEIQHNLSPNKVWDIFLKTLTEKDFEIDYYKLRVLLMLGMNQTSLESNEENNNGYSNERLENALNITLTAENNILINNNISSKAKMQELIEIHIRKNKSQSLITITTSRNLQYGKYLKFQEILNATISNLKDKFSENKFDKKYAKLNKDEKEFLEKEYSFNVYEKELE